MRFSPNSESLREFHPASGVTIDDRIPVYGDPRIDDRIPVYGGLREYNTCHDPDTGRFCSTDAGFAPLEADPYWRAGHRLEALRSAHRMLMATSFSDTVRESATAIHEGGRDPEIVVGGRDFVQFSPEYFDRLAAAGPYVQVHTHPASAPFSIDDLRVLADRAVVLRPDGTRVQGMERMVVLGRDGTWYEARALPQLQEGDTMVRLTSWVAEQQTAAARLASWRTDKEIQTRLGRPPSSDSDRKALREAHPWVDEVFTQTYVAELRQRWVKGAPRLSRMGIQFRTGKMATARRLTEYNKCHDPATGRFSHATEGRCSAEAQQKRATALRQRPGVARRVASGRLEARRLLRKAPAYLQPDAKRALRDDRAISVFLPSHKMGGEASATQKTISVNMPEGAPKKETLSVLRHEIGHIMPDRLGRLARVVGIDPKQMRQDVIAHAKKDRYPHLMHAAVKGVAARMVRGTPEQVAAAADAVVASAIEEVRAWRNAIKRHGRVDWDTVRRALGSYFIAYTGTREGEDYTERAIAHLRRYARVVRRYRRGAR